MNFRALPIRRVFEIVNGGTPTGNADNWDGEVDWATPTDLAIAHGGVLRSTARTITRKGLSDGSRSIPGNSLILSTRAPIGYVCETGSRMAFNQGCRGLVPRHKVDIRFFRYQLSTMGEQLHALGQGSTFMELGTDALAATLVAVPRFAEQRAIADYLDTETARIDALISKKRRLIELLAERWVAGLIKSTGTKTCNNDDVALGRLIDSTVGGAWGDEQGQGEVDIPCIRGTDFNTDNLDATTERCPIRSLSQKEFRRRRLTFGDLLVEKSGGGDKQPVGRVVQWTGEHTAVPTNFVARMRPANGVDSRFLAFVFRAAYELGLTRAWIKQTTGIQNLDLSGLLSEKWPIPPLKSQRAIARQLDQATHERIRLTCNLENQIDLLHERRTALITAAVTGEIAVPS